MKTLHLVDVEALKVTVGHSWHASVKRAGQEPTGTLPDLHTRQAASSSVGLSQLYSSESSGSRALGTTYITRFTFSAEYDLQLCCEECHYYTISLSPFLLLILQFMKEDKMRSYRINLNKFGLVVN